MDGALLGKMGLCLRNREDLIPVTSPSLLSLATAITELHKYNLIIACTAFCNGVNATWNRELAEHRSVFVMLLSLSPKSYVDLQNV